MVSIQSMQRSMRRKRRSWTIITTARRSCSRAHPSRAAFTRSATSPMGPCSPRRVRMIVAYGAASSGKITTAQGSASASRRASARPGAKLIALVKPQFEAGREEVGKGGVVRDPAIHERVCTGAKDWVESRGWRVVGVTQSPITGPEGNVEFLLGAIKDG